MHIHEVKIKNNQPVIFHGCTLVKINKTSCPILLTCTCSCMMVTHSAASTTSTVKPSTSRPSLLSGPQEGTDKTSVVHTEGPHSEAGAAPAAAPNPEDISIGDSAGSEYETVSFTEETG